MKKAEVKVGETYAVKVSGNVVPVVIDEEHPQGGWVGTNQETNRQVRVKSAQRLRCPWDAYLARGDQALGADEPDATGRETGAKGQKKPKREVKATKAKKRATRANTDAQEPGLGAERPNGSQARRASPEGMRRPAHAGRAQRGLSGLDAAAKVLEEADEPLSCKAIVERAFAAGYWQSEGKTPAATIYAAILREIQKKGDEARFRKVERGKFVMVK